MVSFQNLYIWGSLFDSILDPGVPPTIQGVNQFSGQEKVGGDTKVPTVVYYDTGGNIKAIGSDCTDDDWALDQSEMWFKAEWYGFTLDETSRSLSQSLQVQIAYAPSYSSFPSRQ